MIINEIISAIKLSQKIIISSHINPDGDCIGSSLALYIALKRMGKDVYIILDDSIPEQYKFLPCCQDILHPEFLKNQDSDLFIVVDINETERLGTSKNLLFKSEKTLCIDHHPSDNFFCDYNYVDPKASAASELIYDVLKALTVYIDTDIANCLLTAIITDTGGFKYDNVTPYTFSVASRLLAKGAMLRKINEMVFDKTSLPRIKLLPLVLSTLATIEYGKIGYVFLNKQMLEKSGAMDNDSGGFVNYVKNIDGVEIALMFKIEKDGVRVSFRSKDYVDVNNIAVKFGGGGHKKASGCFINKDYESVKYMILDECRRNL